MSPAKPPASLCTFKSPRVTLASSLLFLCLLFTCYSVTVCQLGIFLLQGFTFILRGKSKLVAFYLTVTLRLRMLSAGDSRLQEWFSGGNVNRKSRALLFGQHVWIRRTSPINMGNCKWAAAVLTNGKTKRKGTGRHCLGALLCLHSVHNWLPCVLQKSNAKWEFKEPVKQNHFWVSSGFSPRVKTLDSVVFPCVSELIENHKMRRR